MNFISNGIAVAESGWLPDWVIRHGIRRMCRQRLRIAARDHRTKSKSHTRFRQTLSAGPIALLPEKANQQHYELPAEFFECVLGPRRKYSCCYFASPGSTLTEAEETALAMTCQHADLADGMDVLELGCGWGSLSLWMAEQFPHSQITAVSNSRSQREYVQQLAQQRGLKNLQLITADINSFQPPQGRFDRVVSVEMFEHMRNVVGLCRRIATWLRPDGKLFVHIFCHRQWCYPFEPQGPADWMANYFFSGGMMPSADLLTTLPLPFSIQRQEIWNGRHYQRTAEAWLENLDRNAIQVRHILQGAYGSDTTLRWLNRWRIFFLSVAELFGSERGEEWHVAHYLMAQ